MKHQLYSILVFILGMGLFVAAPPVFAEQPAAAAGQTVKPAAAGLSNDEGEKLLNKHCADCHLSEKMHRYRKNLDQWVRTIETMVKEAGVKMTNEEINALAEHLARTPASRKIAE